MNKKIFISIEVILYMLFLYLDLTDRAPGLSNRIKYSGIILCFFYALFSSSGDERRRERWCVRTGLFFTVVADYFLIFGDDYFLGVVSFFVVQSVYLYRFYHGISYGWRFALNAATACAACMIARGIHVPIDPLLCMSSIYFVSLVHNVIIAIDKGNQFTAIGMVLFLLCDINVALMNAKSYIMSDAPVFIQIVTIAPLLVWLFYLPSQVLIAMSVEENRKVR